MDHHPQENNNKPEESSSTAPAAATTTSTRRWPAEWMPHAACLLLAPHNPATFDVSAALDEFCHLAQILTRVGDEAVVLLCKSETHQDQVKARLQTLLIGGEQQDVDHSDDDNDTTMPKIHVAIVPSNDSWARDTAPTFVVETETGVAAQHDSTGSNDRRVLVGLDWQFNAYGGLEEGCYWPCHLDQQIASSVCALLSHSLSLWSTTTTTTTQSNLGRAPSPPPTIIQSRSIPLVLEGGSIHTDGQGTILTTQECLLHPSRNPHLDQGTIEHLVLEATGGTKMIWLPKGLAGDDDTNGHVDNFCCFVGPTEVVLAWTDEPGGDDDDNYQRCRAALQILETSTDALGRPIRVHKLPLPPNMSYTEADLAGLDTHYSVQAKGIVYEETVVAPRAVGDCMAASYVNFYIANRAVLVPQFGHAASDARAVKTLQDIFDKLDGDGHDTGNPRVVVGIPSRHILVGGGNLHCITQQVPAVSL